MNLFRSAKEQVTEKSLSKLWNELNQPSEIPSLDEIKTFVYNKIARNMNKNKRQFTMKMDTVYYEKEITDWLEQVHDLECAVGDYENDDGSITKYLVVSW